MGPWHPISNLSWAALARENPASRSAKATKVPGARSGKSRFALGQGNEGSFDPLIFLATASAGDAEMKERIERHRVGRDPKWRTVEEPYRLTETLAGRAIEERGLVVVDCLTLWVSNLLCGMGGNELSLSESEKILDEFLSTVPRSKGHIRFVSNEVGLSIVPDNKLGRDFRDLQGLLNQKLAILSDEVFFLTAGLPHRLK
jgi:adenosylcobinamide kinase/adenosylcobinamide-phosphate guanylyltransferase